MAFNLMNMLQVNTMLGHAKLEICGVFEKLDEEFDGYTIIVLSEEIGSVVESSRVEKYDL